MKKWKIGIIGVGILGGAAKHYYEEIGHKVFCFDKFKNIGSIENVNKADIVFVCVPTPRGKNDECNISIVDEAIGYLTGKKIVIIKSTVIPGTTDALQLEYPRHQVLFCPEFLTERRANEDFMNPKLQILGHTLISREVSENILKILPHAQYSKTMPAIAAELFKYFRNSYLATKNSFANQFFELCNRAGIDYKYIKDCAEADPWIGPEHLDAMHGGFRGFNGKCLPKDTEALLEFANKHKVDLDILKRVVKYNNFLLVSQNIEKDS